MSFIDNNQLSQSQNTQLNKNNEIIEQDENNHETNSIDYLSDQTLMFTCHSEQNIQSEQESQLLNSNSSTQDFYKEIVNTMNNNYSISLKDFPIPYSNLSTAFSQDLSQFTNIINSIYKEIYGYKLIQNGFNPSKVINNQTTITEQNGTIIELKLQTSTSYDCTCLGIFFQKAEQIIENKMSEYNIFNSSPYKLTDTMQQKFYELDQIQSIKNRIDKYDLRLSQEKSKYSNTHETVTIDRNLNNFNVDAQTSIKSQIENIKDKCKPETKGSFNICQWNCRGLENNKDQLEAIVRLNDIEVLNLVETWKLGESLNIQDQEACQPAKFIKVGNRNSGGVQIGSNLPSCKKKTAEGYCKLKVNGIHFITIYINQDPAIQKKSLINHVKQLVSEGKKIIISIDANHDSKLFYNIFKSFGMNQVKLRSHKKSEIPIEFLFTQNVNVSLEKTISMYNGSKLQHNSDHDCFIFKVKEQMTLQQNFRLCIPNETDKLTEFIEEQKRNRIIIEDKVFDRAKCFQIAIQEAAINLKQIKYTKSKPKLKSQLNDDQKEELTKIRKEANKQFKSDKSKQDELNTKATNLKKEQNKSQWESQTENGVKNSKFFKTINTLCKKGNLQVDGEYITEMRSRKVELETNEARTTDKWTRFMTTKFDDANYSTFEASDLKKNSIDIKIDEGLIQSIFSKCKMSTSPGPSKIGYKLLKNIFENDTDFFTTMVQDVINDKCDTSLFSLMDVIPIYKSSKKGNPNDCKSYRIISLAENLFKIAESAFLKVTIDEVESQMNSKQFAYKRKSGTKNACEELFNTCKRRKKGLIVSCDFASAFDKISRNAMFTELFKKLKNQSFLHMYKRTLENLELNLNLSFLNIPGIKSKIGAPQGMKFSAYIFCLVVDSILVRVKELCPQADFVLQSDDLTFVVSNQEEYINTIKTLIEISSEQGLNLDTSKTQFTDFGVPKGLYQSLPAVTDDVTVIEKSKNMRFLGIYIHQTILFNLNMHIQQREKNTNVQIENKLLRQVCSNWYFSLKSKRIFLMNRTFARLYHGVGFLNKFLNPEFDQKQAFEFNETMFLDKNWTVWDKLDQINFSQLPKFIKSNGIVKGMIKPEAALAVLRIKPLHTYSYKFIRNHTVSLYWLKKLENSNTLLKNIPKYINLNEHIIDNLLKKKNRLQNEHLILSLLSGHQVGWISLNQNKQVTFKCKICNQNYSINNLYSDKTCCGLKIPGNVPIDYTLNSTNIEFNNFVNRLKHHPMYKSYDAGYKDWKVDVENNLNVIKTNLNIDKKELNPDRFLIQRNDTILARSQIVAYTDGSFKDGLSSSAVLFIQQKQWNLRSLTVLNPPPQTNIRGELQAILLAILNTNHLKHVKLTIKTDSEQSINAIKRWQSIWKWNGFKNNSGKNVKNIDLIMPIMTLSEGRDIQYIHVRSHSGIISNELVDNMAGSLINYLIRNNLNQQQPEPNNKNLNNLSLKKMINQEEKERVSQYPEDMIKRSSDQIFSDENIVINVFMAKGNDSEAIKQEMLQLHNRITEIPGFEAYRNRNVNDLIYMQRPTQSEQGVAEGALLACKSPAHLVCVKRWFQEMFEELDQRGWRLWRSENKDRPTIKDLPKSQCEFYDELTAKRQAKRIELTAVNSFDNSGKLEFID